MKKNDLRKQRKLIFILAIIAFGSIAAALLLWKNPSLRFTPKPPPAPPAAGARIFFAPSLLTLKNATGKQTVDLVVDSGGNAIGQVTVRLSYDPKLLTNVQAAASDFSKANYTLKYTLVNGAIDKDQGQIYMAFAVLPSPVSTGAVTPKAVKIATISFTLLSQPAAGKPLFAFLPLTAVYPPAVFTGTSFSVGNGTGKPVPQTPAKSLLQVVEPLKAN